MIKSRVLEKQELGVDEFCGCYKPKNHRKGGSWSTAKRGAFADP